MSLYGQNDVLFSLRREEWRYTGQVRHEMIVKKPQSFLNKLLDQPDVLWIAETLERFVSAGLAEQKWESDPNRSRFRSRGRYLMFRLSEKGVKERDRRFERTLARRRGLRRADKVRLGT